MPVCKHRNYETRISLKTLGDGIFRVFQIALLLVNARNGVLLIDEFENGLHWKVQSDIWHAIFRIAQENDIQIFATTHSRDCAKSFLSAWRENEELGSFSRIERDPEQGARQVSYDLETLSDTIETDVEFR